MRHSGNDALHLRVLCAFMGGVDYELIPNVDRDSDLHPERMNQPVRVPNVWHLARGGDLPGWIWFRLAQGRDGEWICAELAIDHHNRPLTSTVLRRIPLSTLIDDLLTRTWGALDRGGPFDLRSQIREFYDSGSLVGLTAEQIAAGGRTADWTPERVLDLYMPNANEPAVASEVRRGGPAPTSATLARFAAAYKRALQTDRRSAIAKTIFYLKQENPPLHITRATANRWRERCRKTEPPLLDPS